MQHLERDLLARPVVGEEHAGSAPATDFAVQGIEVAKCLLHRGEEVTSHWRASFPSCRIVRR